MIYRLKKYCVLREDDIHYILALPDNKLFGFPKTAPNSGLIKKMFEVGLTAKE